MAGNRPTFCDHVIRPRYVGSQIRAIFHPSKPHYLLLPARGFSQACKSTGFQVHQDCGRIRAILRPSGTHQLLPARGFSQALKSRPSLFLPLCSAKGPAPDMSTPSEKGEVKKRGRSISFIQVLVVAIPAGLVAAGLVPRKDLLFAAIASVYIVVVAKTAFPPTALHGVDPAYSRTKGFKRYTLGAAVVGVLLPTVLILLSLLSGDGASARDAAPHLFLVCAQVFSEGLTAVPESVSLPVRALIPILYNSRRLITLWDWTACAIAREGSLSSLWTLFERSVALSNLLFWNFNLWVFLLVMYLPTVFTKVTVAAKRAES